MSNPHAPRFSRVSLKLTDEQIREILDSLACDDDVAYLRASPPAKSEADENPSVALLALATECGFKRAVVGSGFAPHWIRKSRFQPPLDSCSASLYAGTPVLTGTVGIPAGWWVAGWYSGRADQPDAIMVGPMPAAPASGAEVVSTGEQDLTASPAPASDWPQAGNREPIPASDDRLTDARRVASLFAMRILDAGTGATAAWVCPIGLFGPPDDGPEDEYRGRRVRRGMPLPAGWWAAVGPNGSGGAVGSKAEEIWVGELPHWNTAPASWAKVVRRGDAALTTSPAPAGIRAQCEPCAGIGLVSDPQHGHAMRCPNCDGKGNL